MGALAPHISSFVWHSLTGKERDFGQVRHKALSPSGWLKASVDLDDIIRGSVLLHLPPQSHQAIFLALLGRMQDGRWALNLQRADRPASFLYRTALKLWIREAELVLAVKY